LQQILVPLDQSLRVNLAVLDLFFTITLDAFKQRLQALLVFLA